MTKRVGGCARIHVLAVLLSVLAFAGCATTPHGGAKLAGMWTPMSAEMGGADYPVKNFESSTLRLTADYYDFAGDKGTYAVIATKHPATMDILGTEGPNAGRTIPAIFLLQADRLTICYQLGKGDRPVQFASPKGSQVLLVHYKRMP